MACKAARRSLCGIALGSGSNAQVLHDPASFLRHISAAGDTRRKIPFSFLLSHVFTTLSSSFHENITGNRHEIPRSFCRAKRKPHWGEKMSVFGVMYKMGYFRENLHTKQKTLRKNPSTAYGGPPRTERSPLPCGHLPTPWGVTPFRGGFTQAPL